MPRLPDDRDHVDHVLATIDGALESYGDSMRWSPDPPEPEVPGESYARMYVDGAEIPGVRPARLDFYSGALGDYAGVPVRAVPILRSGESFTLRYTVNLEAVNRMNESWAEIMGEARAAFVRMNESMLNVGRSLNRLTARLQVDPPPPPPEMPEQWKRALAAKAMRGHGPASRPFRHRGALE